MRIKALAIFFFVFGCQTFPDKPLELKSNELAHFSNCHDMKSAFRIISSPISALVNSELDVLGRHRGFHGQLSDPIGRLLLSLTAFDDMKRIEATGLKLVGIDLVVTDNGIEGNGIELGLYPSEIACVIKGVLPSKWKNGFYFREGPNLKGVLDDRELEFQIGSSHSCLSIEKGSLLFWTKRVLKICRQDKLSIFSLDDNIFLVLKEI